jgi:hypothetical protein
VPLLGLGLVGFAVANLPSADCGFGDKIDDGMQRTEVVLAAVAMTAISLAWAVRRLVAMRNAGELTWSPAVIALFVLAPAAFAAVALFAVRPIAYGLLAIGIAATLALCFYLLFEVCGGRGVREVGLALPAYLVGAALFCYPSFAVIALALQGGSLC